MTQIEVEVEAVITRGEIHMNSICEFPSIFLNCTYQYRKLVFFGFVPGTGFQSQPQIIGMSFHSLVLLKQRAKINQFVFTF